MLAGTCPPRLGHPTRPGQCPGGIGFHGADSCHPICASAGSLGSVPSRPHLPGTGRRWDDTGLPSCPVQVAWDSGGRYSRHRVTQCHPCRDGDTAEQTGRVWGAGGKPPVPFGAQSSCSARGWLKAHEGLRQCPQSPPCIPQRVPALVHIRDLLSAFSNKMQISNCLAIEEKITVNKISVTMETIKNRLPTLPLLAGNVQLSSFTPHYYYFLIMNNFLLSIGRWINTRKFPKKAPQDGFQSADAGGPMFMPQGESPEWNRVYLLALHCQLPEMSVCLLVYLSACWSVCLSAFLSVRPLPRFRL